LVLVVPVTRINKVAELESHSLSSHSKPNELGVYAMGLGSASAETSSLMSEFLRQAGGSAVVDGGLATELERQGADLNDPLWSAKCLLTSPHLIRKVLSLRVRVRVRVCVKMYVFMDIEFYLPDFAIVHSLILGFCLFIFVIHFLFCVVWLPRKWEKVTQLEMFFFFLMNKLEMLDLRYSLVGVPKERKWKN